jgi:hypothetical protein
VPSQILHALFGEDLLAALDRDFSFRPALEGRRAAFILGCQGPDIFYHSQMTRPVGLEYGALLHRRAYGSFAATLFDLVSAAEAAVGGAAGDLVAYAWGFATHAALDRACHPYIIYKTARLDGKGERNIHAFFERILDVVMLEELRGQPVSSWDQASLTRICEDPPLGLRELLAEALRRTFPERAGKDAQLVRRVDSAFQDCAFFYRHTDPGKTSFLQVGTATRLGSVFGEAAPVLLFPEALPSDIDYLNREGRPWHYPLAGSEEDRRSFPEIYAQALEATLEILAPLAGGSPPGGEEIARRIGNGGLSIQDRNGKPCPPTLSDPLPLERVLEQQRRAREQIATRKG